MRGQHGARRALEIAVAWLYRHDPALRLPWDREDFLEMLGNLLDNACKWADAEVRLTVSETERSYL